MGINVNIDQPRYDQGTYVGRAKHFFLTTNPLNVFASEKQLEEAKDLVTRYRNEQSLPSGTTEEDLWRAKTLYDSAFHPDTGEKMILIGRMSAQVPMNMIITGGMMAFYKSTPAVIFWQWFNQSFNALVNFTNRSGDATFTEKQIATSYVLATSGAVATALGLNRLCRNAPPLLGRLVPLAAISAANCINIPLMRVQELQQGTTVYDEDNNKLGYSKKAAASGITQVIFSRIAMAMPGMSEWVDFRFEKLPIGLAIMQVLKYFVGEHGPKKIVVNVKVDLEGQRVSLLCHERINCELEWQILTPVLINHLEKKGILQRRPWINLPVQVGFVGVCLTFATPLACAFFKQKAQYPYKKLESELREELDKKLGSRAPQYVFYNKGL